MRIAVKKILRKHGYPPDLELKATETVIEQARMMASEFSKTKEYRLDVDTDSLFAAEPWLMFSLNLAGYCHLPLWKHLAASTIFGAFFLLVRSGHKKRLPVIGKPFRSCKGWIRTNKEQLVITEVIIYPLSPPPRQEGMSAKFHHLTICGCEGRSRTYTRWLAEVYPMILTPETRGHGCQFHHLTIFII